MKMKKNLKITVTALLRDSCYYFIIYHPQTKYVNIILKIFLIKKWNCSMHSVLSSAFSISQYAVTICPGAYFE